LHCCKHRHLHRCFETAPSRRLNARRPSPEGYIWLYWLMNAVAPVLAGIAIIYIVSKVWGWWFSKHDGRRDGK